MKRERPNEGYKKGEWRIENKIKNKIERMQKKFKRKINDKDRKQIGDKEKN